MNKLNLLSIPDNVKPFETKLGEKIIKSNSFIMNIINNGLFMGLKHIPIIKNVIYILTNYSEVYEISGKLIDNNMWILSPYLIPLNKLIEYSVNLKLDVRIETTNSNGKFSSFYAYYYNHLSNQEQKELNNVMYLSIPTYKDDVKIEFIGNIWKLSRSNKIN